MTSWHVASDGTRRSSDAPRDEAAKPGWWEAIVLARDNDMLTLKWRDWPGYPNIVRHAGAVALLKPTLVNS